MKTQKEKSKAMRKTLLIVKTLSLLIIGFLIIQGSLALFSHISQAIQIRTTIEPKTHAEQIIEDTLKEDPGAAIVEQTESSLTFHLSNGQYKFVSVTGRLFTEDGEPIDTSLTQLSNSEWIAQTSKGLDYALKFKSDSTRRYYPRKNIDDEYIEIGAPEYLDEEAWQKLPVNKPHIERNRLYFEQPDYTLEYLVTPYGVKTNLILDNPIFNKTIRYKLTLHNLTRSQESIISNLDNETVANFVKPHWYDSGDKSGDIQYSIEDSYITYSNPDLTDATYPVTIDPTYGPTGIAAGGDDYYHYDTSWSSATTDVLVGSVAGSISIHMGLRFLGLDIATGSTISSSTIDLRTATAVGSGTLLTKIRAVDENDPAAATSNATCGTDDAMRTTTGVDWDPTISNTNNTLMTTANFSAVVQESNDSGFTDGSVAYLVQIINDGTTGDNRQAWASYEHASYTEPQLTIVYTLPDTTAPTVSTFSPADNATGVATTANLVITFDEAVDAEAGANNDIIIKKTSDNSTIETIDAQDAKVTGSGTAIITVNPATTFDYSTGYYVQIGADAFDDTAGNSYAGISDTTSWNFTTESQVSNNYLESVTFDTESDDGFAINSIYWEGTLVAGSTVGFQFAVATSTDFSGVDFLGEDGSVSTLYSATDSDGSEAIPINGVYHHPFESGYKYFRYRVYLDKTSGSPEVTKVSINWTK
ncbi:MAG: hypothetical protein UX31_C0013G0017 [Candidatus Nomurabacteria bacterium GW2011_GWA1_46_11]|uniref:SbsA Ig-like domain-containing protein n=2 Tax=Parcubacteria group TaxID=1794811 RepID=A0A1G1YYB3_9BACT|nr:MAG: hypothetical protein UX29_C0020G0006 [Parcubacteria group bacterium GW2011_GWA2_46_10]KKU21743.1 MAG: hypothetical protein UX31_C0013G0017 [Candidatus Nomurabacteria bacterium GW2011_GWA1_46_11]OGY56640.1 MAG: hypothetical protein A2119_00355 [Candidatus Colwellbacteria bacterium GWA2_46_10]